MEANPSITQNRRNILRLKKRSSFIAKRVLLLTNCLTAYRIPTIVALNRRFDDMKILLSSPTIEEDHQTKELKIVLQKGLHFKSKTRHPSGFEAQADIHIPYDTFFKLWKFKPNIVLAGEMGARSLQAVLYCLFRPACRLVIHADLSERTEEGRGRVRRASRAFLLRFANAVIVNGESGSRYIRSFNYPAKSIFCIPYATDGALFGKTKHTSDYNSVRRLLYVGQLIERKGILPFITTLSSWLQESSHYAMELTLIGEGPLKETIEAAKVPRNLKLNILGTVPYRRLPYFYANADIFVLPTLADTWAVVVNEAMAAGVPVLGSIHSQAVSELVVDGISGWRFNPESKSDVMGALRRALSVSTNELRTMGKKAREIALRITPDYVAEGIAKALMAAMK